MQKISRIMGTAVAAVNRTTTQQPAGSIDEYEK